MFVAVDFFAPFANLLAWLYSIWPSYAGMIVLYTLIIMVAVTPLTLKGTRSMMQLQLLQPEMKKLQAQYKDDRQKLNEEMMRFYRENNINPLGGCLPLLIQLPVFFILYRVLHGLTTMGDCVNASGQHVQGFDPQYISKSSELYQSLHCQTTMDSWGMDLARSATSVLSDSFVKAIPYLLLVVGVAITSYVQQRQISGRNPAAASNPQQQMLMRIGPIMITFFSLIVQAGLAVYFFVSNLYRVGQQALISRTIYSTPDAKRLMEQQMKAAEEQKKSGQKKGFFESLLGDARPQLDKKAPSKGSSGNGKRSPKTGDKSRRDEPGGDKTGDEAAGGSVRPPSAKGNGGRTTPPKPRSASARKKRKRK